MWNCSRIYLSIEFVHPVLYYQWHIQFAIDA